MNYALQLNSNTKLSHSNLLFIPITILDKKKIHKQISSETIDKKN